MGKDAFSKQCQASGIDGYFQLSNRDVVAFEVKCEQQTTGNLFLETLSNKETGREGWFYTSQSDYVIYYFLDTNLVHSFSLAKARAWVESVAPGTYKVAEQAKYEQRNTTVGILVPIIHLKEKS